MTDSPKTGPSNHKPRGKVVVIAAPSGAGKTSLVKALIESSANIDVAVSHTTRPMRPHEVDGVNYHFVSQNEFKALLEQDGFIESAEVFGNLYGTSREAMGSIINQGKHLVLEIDYQGASQIRQQVAGAISIFILPKNPVIGIAYNITLSYCFYLVIFVKLRGPENLGRTHENWRT